MICYTVIPQNEVDALARYVFDGLRPGGFLQAVLANDLAGAFGRGICIDFDQVHSLVALIHNEIPSTAHGSTDAIDTYLAQDEETRKRVSDWCKLLRRLYAPTGPNPDNTPAKRRVWPDVV